MSAPTNPGASHRDDARRYAVRGQAHEEFGYPMDWLTVAGVHATVALAEEQRTANLIAHGQLILACGRVPTQDLIDAIEDRLGARAPWEKGSAS